MGLPLKFVERTVADLAEQNVSFDYLPVLIADAPQNKGVTPPPLAHRPDGPGPAYGFTSGLHFVETSRAETMPDNTAPAGPATS